jgi:gamma-glutamylcyclotransferase (GGCT)/AIG2-like uncharacterized protein YtfP
MGTETFNLFVYGTLKAGGANAHRMEGCQHLGPAQLGGILYDIDGQHPALVLYGGKLVSGELWHCPWELLAELDAFEGVQTGLFRRVGVRVRAQSGEELACWTYVAGPKLAHKLMPARRISSWNARAPQESPSAQRPPIVVPSRPSSPPTGHS